VDSAVDGDAPRSLGSVSHSSPIPRRHFFRVVWNKQPPHAERADILARLPGCWEMAHAFLQEAPWCLYPCRSGRLHGPTSPASRPLVSSSAPLPAKGLKQLFLKWTGSSRSQLCPRRSLYSSGTRSGSTGLGKKCVNFWCRLDLVPSLRVPSLFNATK